MWNFAKGPLIAAFFPFVVALIMEFFQQELVIGGLSEGTFSLVHQSLYLISEVLFLVAVWKGQMSQKAKIIWTFVLTLPYLLNIVPALTGKKVLPLLFGK